MNGMRLIVVLVVIAVAQVGCFEPLKEVKGRSAIEQQVTSVAIERAINMLEIPPDKFNDTYKIKVTGLAGTDKEWVQACLQRRLHAEGIRVDQSDNEDLSVMEAIVTYAGSDLEMMIFGVPLFIPGIPAALGDVSVLKWETQHGRAKIGLCLWSPEEELLFCIKDKKARVKFMNHTYLTFIGPFIYTDIEGFK